MSMIAARMVSLALPGIALVGVLLTCLPGPAAAQAPGCTTTRRAGPPPLEVLSCGDGLTITAEAGAILMPIDRDGDGQPEAATLDAKAVLVDRPPGEGGFQILTPHAVAAVRGTVWAVEVSTERTSVFVESGRVEVGRSGGGEPVTLSAGEGVDVEAGTGPLTVRRWEAARVAVLLARFGR